MSQTTKTKHMEREIKFRGKDFTGTWWVGDLTHDQNGNPLISKPKYGMHVYVAEESIGQYTGLNDINGKDIYEGDILRHDRNDIDSSPIAQVAWIGSGFQFVLGDNYYLDVPLYQFCPSEYMEIVGNIHDNPSLLKGGNHAD